MSKQSDMKSDSEKLNGYELHARNKAILVGREDIRESLLNIMKNISKLKLKLPALSGQQGFSAWRSEVKLNVRALGGPFIMVLLGEGNLFSYMRNVTRSNTKKYLNDVHFDTKNKVISDYDMDLIETVYYLINDFLLAKLLEAFKDLTLKRRMMLSANGDAHVFWKLLHKQYESVSKLATLLRFKELINLKQVNCNGEATRRGQTNAFFGEHQRLKAFFEANNITISTLYELITLSGLSDEYDNIVENYLLSSRTGHVEFQDLEERIIDKASELDAKKPLQTISLAKEQVTCFKCGEKGHFKAECKNRKKIDNTTCDYCSKKGHKENVCWKKKRDEKETASVADYIPISEEHDDSDWECPQANMAIVVASVSVADGQRPGSVFIESSREKECRQELPSGIDQQELSAKVSARIAEGHGLAGIAECQMSARVAEGHGLAGIAECQMSARIAEGHGLAGIAECQVSARVAEGQRSARVADCQISARIAEGQRSARVADCQMSTQVDEEQEELCHSAVKENNMISMGSELFILDSGASINMMDNRNNKIRDVKPLSHPITISGITGTIKAYNYGYIWLNEVIRLKIYIVTTTLTHNILSLGCLRAAGIDIVTRRLKKNKNITESFIVQGRWKRRIQVDHNLFKAKLEIYVIPTRENTVHIYSGTFESPTTAHEAAGHPGNDRMKETLKQHPEMRNKLGVIGDATKCDTCISAKGRNKTHAGSTLQPASRIGELVHVDVMGPVNTAGVSGIKYAGVIVDAFTKYTIAVFGKDRKEISLGIMERIQMFERQYGIKIRYIMSDNAKELTRGKLGDWIKTNNVTQLRSAPYSSCSNGQVEKKILDVTRMARCLVMDATKHGGNNRKDFYRYLWPYAFQHAVYLTNRLATKGNKDNICPATKIKGLTSGGIISDNLRWGQSVGAQKVGKEISKGDKLSTRLIRSIWLGKNEHFQGGAIAYGNRVFIRRSFKRLNEKNTVQNSGSYYNHNRKVIDDTQFLFSVNDKTTGIDRVGNETPDDGVLEEEMQNNVFDDPQDDQLVGVQDDVVNEHNSEIVEEQKTQPIRRSERNQPQVDYSNKAQEQQSLLNQYNNNEGKETVLISTAAERERSMGRKPTEVPRNFQEAMKSKVWQEAIKKELNNMFIKQKALDIISKEEAKRVIITKRVRMHWIFDAKTDQHGNVIKRKGRLVALGNLQPNNNGGVYSPVIDQIVLRILQLIAMKMGYIILYWDVDAAYLNALSDPGCMVYPFPGVKLKEGETIIMKKMLYGLRESAKAWYDVFDRAMIKLGWMRSKSTPCIYYKNKMMLGVYVDDMMVIGPKQEEIKREMEMLNKEFKLKQVDGAGFVGQQWVGKDILVADKRITSLVKEYNLEEASPMSTPMVAGYVPYEESKAYEGPCPEINIRPAIGSLSYLAKWRPDIAYAVNKLSREQVNPGPSTMKAVKRIIRYLKGTIGKGIDMRRTTMTEQGLVIYSDSDFAKGPKGRSTTGYFLYLWGKIVTFKSKLQKGISQSTCEAEYMAMYNAVIVALYVKKLLIEMNQDIGNMPIKIYCDNQAAIKVAGDTMYAGKLRHIATKYYLLQELCKEGKLKVEYVNTSLNRADILTKALARMAHTTHTDRVTISN